MVKWVAFSNPSREDEYPWSVCVGGEHVYVVGYEESSGTQQWHIEKRDKDDGRLVKTWTRMTGSIGGTLMDCVVVGDSLYTVGDTNEVYEKWKRVSLDAALSLSPFGVNWAILSLDLDLNFIKVKMEGVSGHAHCMTSDGQYLYIAGTEERSGRSSGWRGRVEKRRLDNLSLVTEYASRGFILTGGIGINPATGHLWVMGMGWKKIYYKKYYWRVEVLDRDLNRLMVMRPGVWGVARGVVFDDIGNAYIYGNGVVKISANGKELSRSTDINVAGAAYVDGRLYVVTSDYRLLVLDPDLEKVDEVDLRPEIFKHVDVGEFDYVYKAVFDGGTIYAAGGAVPRGASDKGWLVLAIPISASRGEKTRIFY